MKNQNLCLPQELSIANANPLTTTASAAVCLVPVALSWENPKLVGHYPL
jgi:hypothetical protein